MPVDGGATDTAREGKSRSRGPPYLMTQDIHIWHPDSDGDFPVVYAMHGLGGSGSGWDVIGPALAEHGIVVFAPDYRSTDSAQGRWGRTVQDLVCGYRYAREIAGDYGGDLARPVTFVGHSLGAEMTIGGGLDTTDFVPDGPYDVCFTGTLGPDAIVERFSSTIGNAGEWNVKFAKLDSPSSLAGADGRVVERGDFAVTAGADDSGCYAGSYMMTWKPTDNGAWGLQHFAWQDVEAEAAGE